MRRWHIIKFPNEFPEGKEIYLSVPEEEYECLAKKVVEILPELLKRGHFKNMGSVMDRRNNYIEASNPLPLFLDECCVKDELSYVSYNQLHNVYVQYLLHHKKRKVKSREFKDALENEGFFVERTTRKEGEEWKNGFFVDGLKLNYVNYVNYVRNSNSFPLQENQVENKYITNINYIKKPFEEEYIE